MISSRAAAVLLAGGLFTIGGSALAQEDRRASEEKPDKESRKPEHLRVGALVGVGAPRPLSVEALLKIERTVALGLEYSALPSVNVSDVQLSCWALAGSARVFPFQGAFFVGLRAGRQHLNASTTLSGYGYSVPIAMGVDTTFLNPQIGFLWTWDPGFSIGLDAGVQIPLSSTSASTLASASMPTVVQSAVAPVQQTMESIARAVGQTTLPTVDLVRIGMLF